MSTPNEKPRRRSVVVPVLFVLLTVAVAGWVREVTKSPELVEVVVAKKELHAGGLLSEWDVEDITTVKWLPKSELPKDVITNPQELKNKLLLCRKHADDYFRLKDVTPQFHATFLAGKDIFTMPFPWRGDLEVTNRVDILGSFSEGEQHHHITVLPDVHIVALSTAPSQHGPPSVMVSFGVSEEEAKTLILARDKKTQFDLLLRHPESPPRYPTLEERERIRKQVVKFLINPAGEKIY